MEWVREGDRAERSLSSSMLVLVPVGKGYRRGQQRPQVLRISDLWRQTLFK